MKKHPIPSTWLIALVTAASALSTATASAQDPSQSPPRDVVAALRAKAESGDPAAQNLLGFRYENGAGVPKDLNEALEWYTRAAEQGNGAAQNNLCKFYGKSANILDKVNPKPGESLEPIEPVSEGTKTDVDGMRLWCELAAEQVFVDSKRRLGILYAKGSEGVAPDYEKAYFWLSLGVDNDFFKEVAKRLTAEQRGAQDRKVQEWIEAHK